MIYEGQLFPLTFKKPDFIFPEVVKTVADSGDFVSMIGADGVPYKIATANFLAGIGIGGGSAARTTQICNINNAIAQGENYATSFTVAKSYELFSVSCQTPIRIRIYNSQASQQADLNRSANVLPGNNTGLIFEGITAVGSETINLSPVATVYNIDSFNASYITVTNLSTTSVSSLNFQLSYLPLENNEDSTTIPTSPTITGLVAWMDASHTPSTSTANTWLDRSGNDNDLNSSALQNLIPNALNGKSVFSIGTGSAANWGKPLLGQEEFTVIVVAKNRATNNEGNLLNQYTYPNAHRTKLYIGRENFLAGIGIGDIFTAVPGDSYTPDFDIYCYQKTDSLVSCQSNNSAISSTETTLNVLQVNTKLAGDCALDIAEILIYDRQLTIREIVDNKAYLSNKWVPTEESTGDSDPNVLLLLRGESIIDSSADPKTINNINGVTVSSTEKIYFSGSNKLEISSSLFAFGLSDFCLEGFVRWESTNFSNEPGIFQLSGSNGGLQPSYFNSLGIGIAPALDTGVPYYFLIANNKLTYGSIIVASQTRDYFAIKRTSGITSFSINTIKACEIEDETDYLAENLCIGGYYSNQYLGKFHLDQFRISNITRNTSVVPTKF